MFGMSDPPTIQHVNTSDEDVKDGVNADGTKLQLWQCVSGNTNQQWARRPLGGVVNK